MKSQFPFGLSLSKPRLYELPFDKSCPEHRRRVRANGSNFTGPQQYLGVCDRQQTLRWIHARNHASSVSPTKVSVSVFIFWCTDALLHLQFGRFPNHEELVERVRSHFRVRQGSCHLIHAAIDPVPSLDCQTQASAMQWWLAGGLP